MRRLKGLHIVIACSSNQTFFVSPMLQVFLDENSLGFSFSVKYLASKCLSSVKSFMLNRWWFQSIVCTVPSDQSV